jgi:hypothetical protein
MPRYRVISETAVVNSVVYHRGAGVTSSGWPTVHMKPLDEEARRIADYYRRRHHAPGLPLSPYIAAFGCFYLPELLPDVPGRKINGWIKDDAALVGMPRYTTNSGVTELSGLTVMAGDEFTFIAWPSHWFVPVNDEAHRVADYFAEHCDNPKLPPCPWDEFTRSVFLPDLPPIDTSYRPPQSEPHHFTPTRLPEPRITRPLLDRDPRRPSGHLTHRRAAKAARQQNSWQEFEP